MDPYFHLTRTPVYGGKYGQSSLFPYWNGTFFYVKESHFENIKTKHFNGLTLKQHLVIKSKQVSYLKSLAIKLNMKQVYFKFWWDAYVHTCHI